MNRFREFLAEIYHIWIAERPGVLAASLAYYAVFSFVPIVYIAFAFAGIFVNELAFVERFYSVLRNTIGEDAAFLLQESLAKMGRETSNASMLATVIGFIAILFTASLMFFQLQYVLNTIWRSP